MLLVRYSETHNGSTFLVGPGGGIQLDEDILVGLEREVFEETQIRVQPGKMLFVEDLLTQKYRMIKI
jgi:8-oxo-dGTP pyrophosphatase MutT (NUDIX family)